jgi:hypothetical protein
MEKKLEREYLPLLQYVMILTEKGIPTTVDSVAGTMAIGAIDAKKGKSGDWYVAKEEMLKRLKASGRKLEPVEAGCYSLYGFLYELSKYGVEMDEETIYGQMTFCSIRWKKDQYGRIVIPAHELEKRVRSNSKHLGFTKEDIIKDIAQNEEPLPSIRSGRLNLENIG